VLLVCDAVKVSGPLSRCRLYSLLHLCLSCSQAGAVNLSRVFQSLLLNVRQMAQRCAEFVQGGAQLGNGVLRPLTLGLDGRLHRCQGAGFSDVAVAVQFFFGQPNTLARFILRGRQQGVCLVGTFLQRRPAVVRPRQQVPCSTWPAPKRRRRAAPNVPEQGCERSICRAHDSWMAVRGYFGDGLARSLGEKTRNQR
jgi:hypothetical protein